MVVDNVTMENYWERKKPIYDIGQIELQSHSSKLYFKNIYIKELPPENSQAQSSDPSELPKAFVDGTGPGWVAAGRSRFSKRQLRSRHLHLE